eukprot:6172996-Pleurochrysis_carterae.AAC.5
MRVVARAAKWGAMTELLSTYSIVRSQGIARTHYPVYKTALLAQFDADESTVCLLQISGSGYIPHARVHSKHRRDRSFHARSDIFLTYQPELRAVAEKFANLPEIEWKKVFAEVRAYISPDEELQPRAICCGKHEQLRACNDAWTKMMNADRFDGPTANACDSSFIETDACGAANEGKFCSPTSKARAAPLPLLDCPRSTATSSPR